MYDQPEQVLPDATNMLASLYMMQNGFGGGYGPGPGLPSVNPLATVPPPTYGGGNPLTFGNAPGGNTTGGTAGVPSPDYTPSGLPFVPPGTRFTPVGVGEHTIGMTGNLTSGEQIRNIVGASVQSVFGPGSRVEISSGHRPGDHDSQHGGGHAIDFAIYKPDGTRVSWDDPGVKEVMRVARESGAMGFGAGPTYMGGNSFHIDTGAGAPNGFVRNRPMVWSDSGSGAANHGPGAAHWLPYILGGG